MTGDVQRLWFPARFSGCAATRRERCTRYATRSTRWPARVNGLTLNKFSENNPRIAASPANTSVLLQMCCYYFYTFVKDYFYTLFWEFYFTMQYKIGVSIPLESPGAVNAYSPVCPGDEEQLHCVTIRYLIFCLFFCTYGQSILLSGQV